MTRTAKPLARVAIIVVAVALAAACVFIVITATRVARQSAVDDTRRAPVIVVFGAAEYAGRPSPVYRARLDHAYMLFRQGLAPLIVTTGGGGGDANYTEGGVGRDYLLARGVPDSDLIAETQSSDTARSAVRVAAILRANGVHECLAVSDAYHMFRVKQLMEEQGITTYVSPRPNSMPHGSFARVLTCLREGLSFLLYKLDIT